MMIGGFSLTFTMVLAYLLRIIEGGIEIDKYNNIIGINPEFKYIGEALWYIYATFTTIGYGDLIPNTNIGRVIGIITVISGSSLLSITIITIEEHFGLNLKEKNVSLCFL
jgi:voltage-gated potassium channel Kch